MAEKFMTRRERREAERRAADEAYDAQQSPEADELEASAEAGEPEVAEAPRSDPEQTSAPAPTDVPEVDVPAVVPEAPADTPEAPAPAPATPADTPEVPRFASRGERKRFLREHGLPSDISTAAIPQVLAERESGDSTADAPAGSAHQTVPPTASGMDSSAVAPSTAVVAGTPDDESATTAPITRDGTIGGDGSSGGDESTAEDAPTGEDTANEELADEEPADEEPVGDEHVGEEPIGEKALDEEPADADAAPVDADADADAEIAADQPAEDVDRNADGASTAAPDFDLARHRVDASPSGPDFETSSTAVIAPSAIGDFDAPLRRRTPVVKPPTGSNIRVVTGALPIITPEDLDDNPPTTPLATIDEASLGTGTFSTASRTSAGQTTVATAARSDVWHRAGAASADEEEDSDELEEPPAKPMSARSVTNEDGEILVAERNSIAPYIVLGAAGFVALALVVIALFLLL